jgi:hypothetical protein
MREVRESGELRVYKEPLVRLVTSRTLDCRSLQEFGTDLTLWRCREIPR